MIITLEVQHVVFWEAATHCNPASLPPLFHRALQNLLVAAGHHWPETPPIRPGLALALVLLPPLAMGMWLWRNWDVSPGTPGDQNL